MSGFAKAINTDPDYLVTAFGLIGTREIKGPRHNPLIVRMFARVANWIKDDETAWCGALVGYCLALVGITIPAGGLGVRALRWATYGKMTAAKRGAIGVKRRSGGGHVFFIIGITADRAFYKALGGNQGDMVSIVDIPVRDVVAIRVPDGVVLSNVLPTMPRGTVSTKED